MNIQNWANGILVDPDGTAGNDAGIGGVTDKLSDTTPKRHAGKRCVDQN